MWLGCLCVCVFVQFHLYQWGRRSCRMQYASTFILPLLRSHLFAFFYINFEFLAFCFAFCNILTISYGAFCIFYKLVSFNVVFNYECRLILRMRLWEWVSAFLCFFVCVSLCLCLSICVFMCVCVRGLGGSGQVIHPSTSPCAWWRIWGMLNVALQPLSPHFCMLLHSITFQSSCLQPFLA